MEILDDLKLQELFITREISEGRKKSYRTVFEEMYKLTGKNPSELLYEAKDEEKSFIEDGRIVEVDKRDRKVAKYLFEYYNFLKEAGLKESTINTKMNILRAFYNEFEIELPKKIKISVPRRIIREGDIPNRNDIKKALEFIPDVRNKAIITFAASTGIRTVDVLNFKVEDFVIATKKYHDSDSVDKMLDLKQNNIIPCWEFYSQKTIKSNTLTVTFNTPECSEYIIKYLNQRKNDGEILNNDSYLFTSKNADKMNIGTYKWIYQRINKELFGKAPDGHQFFRPHTMRKFFSTTCTHNSGDLTKINLLTGHKNPNSQVHDAYNSVDTEVMRRFYEPLVKHLSFKDTELVIIKPDDVKKLEKETEEANKIAEESKKRAEESERRVNELMDDFVKIKNAYNLINE